MAYQIQVSKVSIEDYGLKYNNKMFHVTLNLKCWNIEDDPEVDTPIINKNFSSQYTVDPDLTVAQRIAVTCNDLKDQMQTHIDTYKLENMLLNSAAIDAAVSSIESELVG
jgi:hypothetical protein